MAEHKSNLLTSQTQQMRAKNQVLDSKKTLLWLGAAPILLPWKRYWTSHDLLQSRWGRRWWQAGAAVRETKEQRVRLSSSIVSAILGADGSWRQWAAVEQRGEEGRWEIVSQGRRGQMGDGFAREKRGRWGICKGDGFSGWFRKGEEGTLRDL